MSPRHSAQAQLQPEKRPAPKKRIRNFSADDRAAHAEFEKSRREAFRDRLAELAGLLPTLSATDPGRLSKHVVVEESVAHHRLQQSRWLAAVQQVESLTRERDELLAEVNNWRSLCGDGSTAIPRQPASNFAPLATTPPAAAAAAPYPASEPVPFVPVTAPPTSSAGIIPTPAAPQPGGGGGPSETDPRGVSPWPEPESHDRLARPAAAASVPEAPDLWADPWFQIPPEPSAMPMPASLESHASRAPTSTEAAPAAAAALPPPIPPPHVEEDRLSFQPNYLPHDDAFYMSPGRDNFPSALFPPALDTYYQKA